MIKGLTAQYGDYGLPPRQSSFAMHASVVKHYFGGGGFPIGSSGVIVSMVNGVMEAHGAQIMTNAQVAEIRIEQGKVLGVRMQEGRDIDADQIVSGVGIFNTYEQLIPDVLRAKHNFEAQLRKIQPSVGHGCLYMGLKGSPESLELQKNNLWIYPEGVDHDQAVADYLEDQERPFPVVCISFPAAKDPSWNERYPDRSTIDVITLLPYETFAQWDGTQWIDRDREYEALKEQIAQRFLVHLFEQLPHLKDQIDHYELSTPLTTKNFANYQKGELYGIDHSPSRYRQKFLQPRTPIKGRYLTGQDIVTAGVGGALFSGLISASAMTRVMRD